MTPKTIVLNLSKNVKHKVLSLYFLPESDLRQDLSVLLQEKVSIEKKLL